MVKGPIWALERARVAQQEIIKLATSFNEAAALPEETQQKIESLINATAEARKHLTIMDAGTKGAGTEEYQFIRPVQNVELLNKKPGAAMPVIPIAFIR